jgi:hypothetical protein
MEGHGTVERLQRVLYVRKNVRAERAHYDRSRAFELRAGAGRNSRRVLRTQVALDIKRAWVSLGSHPWHPFESYKKNSCARCSLPFGRRGVLVLWKEVRPQAGDCRPEAGGLQQRLSDLLRVCWRHASWEARPMGTSSARSRTTPERQGRVVCPQSSSGIVRSAPDCRLADGHRSPRARGC